MKTATAIYTAQAVTAAAQAEYSAPVAVDLTALSVNDGVIHIKVTNSAAVQSAARTLRLSIAFAQSNESANIARVKASAQIFNVQIPAGASEVSISTSDKITLRAQFIHAWIQHDELTAPVTLDVALIS
jgi:hypothetical protein